MPPAKETPARETPTEDLDNAEMRSPSAADSHIPNGDDGKAAQLLGMTYCLLVVLDCY